MLNCTSEELKLLLPMMDNMLDSTSSSPSRQSATFRHYLVMYKSKTRLKKQLKQLRINECFSRPVKECPLHINDSDPIKAAIARWRLKIGK